MVWLLYIFATRAGQKKREFDAVKMKSNKHHEIHRAMISIEFLRSLIHCLNVEFFDMLTRKYDSLFLVCLCVVAFALIIMWFEIGKYLCLLAEKKQKFDSQPIFSGKLAQNRMNNTAQIKPVWNRSEMVQKKTRKEFEEQINLESLALYIHRGMNLAELWIAQKKKIRDKWDYTTKAPSLASNVDTFSNLLAWMRSL